MVRNLLNGNQERRLATHLQLLLADLDALARPSLKRRVGAVAEVWAARVEDLRSQHLKAYED